MRRTLSPHQAILSCAVWERMERCSDMAASAQAGGQGSGGLYQFFCRRSKKILFNRVILFTRLDFWGDTKGSCWPSFDGNKARPGMLWLSTGAQHFSQPGSAWRSTGTLAPRQGPTFGKAWSCGGCQAVSDTGFRCSQTFQSLTRSFWGHSFVLQVQRPLSCSPLP